MFERVADFDRFTDRARTVMALANQEAHRFNHQHIGSEHILLGLVKEGCGVAAHALIDLGVELRNVRLEVEKVVKSEPEPAAAGKLPQTPQARRVVEYAIDAADNLNHRHVGTEHLLLGLLRDKDDVGAQVLANLGVRIEQLRDEILKLTGDSVEIATRGQLPLPPPPAKRTADELSRTDPLGQLFAKTIAELRARKDQAAWHGEHEIAGQMYEMAEALRSMLERLAHIADEGQGKRSSGQSN